MIESWVVTFVSPTLTCHSKRRSWCRSSKLNAEPKTCTSSCRIPERPGSQAQSVRTCLPSPQAGQLRKELRKHGVELHIASLLNQRLVYPHHPYIALRCPITRCRSGSVPLPPVICSIWSSKGKAVPFPPSLEVSMGRSQLVLHLIIVSLPRTLTGPYFQYPK